MLDYERETTLDEVLAGLDLRSQRFRADLGRPVAARSPDLASSVEVIDLTVSGARVTLMPTASSRAERSPDMQESARFLSLADRVLRSLQSHAWEGEVGGPTGPLEIPEPLVEPIAHLPAPKFLRYGSRSDAPVRKSEG